MGGRAGRPQASQLDGAELLSVAASSLHKREGEFTSTAVRLRVRTADGELRSVGIRSNCVIRLGALHSDSNEFLDLAHLLDRNAPDTHGRTSGWHLSTMQVAFLYTSPSSEATHIKVTGRGRLRVSWLQEFELWNWEPDTKRRGCALCKTYFDKYTWRHHCRSCGRVVCGPCSEHLAVVPGAPMATHCSVASAKNFVLCMNDTRDSASAAVRVCNDCYYGPVMSYKTPSTTPTPGATLPTVASHLSIGEASSDGCYYDDVGRLHIDPPHNRCALLLHYNTSPQWRRSEI